MTAKDFMTNTTAYEIAVKADSMVWSARHNPKTARVARNWLALAARQARREKMPGLEKFLREREDKIL